MDRFSSILRFFGRYKYIITLLIFGVIIVFLDENSILRRMEVANEARNTRNEIEKYRKDFEESTLRLNDRRRSEQYEKRQHGSSERN